MIKWDGLDEAIIGICSRCGSQDMYCYDYNKMVEIFMEKDEMSEEDAVEWIDYNIAGAYVGETTPMILYTDVDLDLEVE